MPEIKPEVTMEINSFDKSKKATELESIVLRIRNLLLQEEGTIPGRFEIGVGLGKYLFEMLNEDLIGYLSSKITTQLADYLPDAPVTFGQIVQGENENKKAIFVYINLDGEIDGKSQIIFKGSANKDGSINIEAFV